MVWHICHAVSRSNDGPQHICHWYFQWKKEEVQEMFRDREMESANYFCSGCRDNPSLCSVECFENDLYYSKKFVSFSYMFKYIFVFQ